MIAETQNTSKFVRDSLVNVLKAETAKIITSLYPGDMRQQLEKANRLNMAQCYVTACLEDVDLLCDPTLLLDCYERPLIHYARRVLRAAQFFGSQYFSEMHAYYANKALASGARVEKNTRDIANSMESLIFKDLMVLRSAVAPYAILWCLNAIGAALSMWGYTSPDNLILEVVEAKKRRKADYFITVMECRVAGVYIV